MFNTDRFFKPFDYTFYSMSDGRRIANVFGLLLVISYALSFSSAVIVMLGRGVHYMHGAALAESWWAWLMMAPLFMLIFFWMGFIISAAVRIIGTHLIEIYTLLKGLGTYVVPPPRPELK